MQFFLDKWNSFSTSEQQLFIIGVAVVIAVLIITYAFVSSRRNKKKELKTPDSLLTRIEQTGGFHKVEVTRSTVVVLRRKKQSTTPELRFTVNRNGYLVYAYPGSSSTTIVEESMRRMIAEPKFVLIKGDDPVYTLELSKDIWHEPEVKNKRKRQTVVVKQVQPFTE